MQKVTDGGLHYLFQKLYATEAQADDLIARNTPKVTVKMWQDTLLTLLLVVGTVQLLAGILFFFAFNWSAIHHFAKLAMVASLLTLSAAGAVIVQARPKLYKTLLMATMVLTGVLLALWGQIYQTGADSYLLFLLWAVLILPMVLLLQSTVSWSFWLMLLNLALLFWGGQVQREWMGGTSMVVATSANGLALLLFERRRLTWSTPKAAQWFGTLLSAVLLLWLVVGSLYALFDHASLFLSLSLFTLATVGITAVNVRITKALAPIVLSFLGAILVIFSGIVKDVSWSDMGVFFGGGILLLFLVSTAVLVLMRISQCFEREAHDEQ